MRAGAMKAQVFIRSYGRAKEITTHKVAPFARVVVPASQASAYEAAGVPGDSLLVIADELDGNLARKMNAILDMGHEWTLILDDDITSIGVWEAAQERTVTPSELAEMVEHYFELAELLGVHLWGVAQKADAMVYDVAVPFGLLAPILGPFTGHIRPTLRYDETVLGKDDYDFWLQNIREYHRTLRVNKFHYWRTTGEQRGGFVSMRSLEIERTGVDRMRAKWGECFKAGGQKMGRTISGENILNSICSVPIEGC